MKSDKELYCKHCNVFHLRNSDNYYFKDNGWVIGCKHFMRQKETPYLDARKLQQKQYYSRNRHKKKTCDPIRRKITRDKVYKNSSDNLTDTYVIKGLSVKFNIPVTEIKKDYAFMIEIYRLHIKCMRACNAPKNLQSFIN